MNDTLYSLPLYYDIAFSWDLEPELDVFERIFERHVPGPVERILEPACGTGRFLVALPKRGYSVTGYDSCPQMAEYARRRVKDAGFAPGASGASGAGVGWAEVIEADMVYAPVVPDGYDAALNSINSMGYLLSDREIVAHFRRTGFSLRPGGIYIAHLACAYADGVPPGETWEVERDGIRVRTVWSVFREEFAARRSFQSWEMVVHDHGRRMRFWDSHVFRLWTVDDIERLAARSGVFELDAVYTERFAEVPAGTRIAGEMGNLYFILKSVRPDG